jgi:hypothetical protein
MLRALRAVLAGIPGIEHVDRQDLNPQDMLAEAQLPAIIIDEERTRYQWTERHHKREAEARSGLILDCQAYAGRSDDRAGYDVSTVRELFVNRVLQELADKATLEVQLDNESEPQTHADDAALQFEVRYPRVPTPKIRALITITVSTDEVFDGRARTSWDTLVADIYSHDDSDDSPTVTMET